MIRLMIDDRSIQVPAGYTLLQAAREHNIDIPTLCYLETLLPYGACRLCLVELTGPADKPGPKVVASCAYPCEEGLIVRTDTKGILEARRAVIELLLSTSGHLRAIRSLAEKWDVPAPYLQLKTNDCILCGLCVRACREIVGVSAINLINRGIERMVSTPFRVSATDCIECATCALVCPTHAIRLEQLTRPLRTSHAWSSAYARRACRLCEYEPAGPRFPENYGEMFGIKKSIGSDDQDAC